MNEKKCSCDFFDGILYIRLSGDIDHHSASGMREYIDKKIFFYRAKSIVMDLSNVDFMDSSGLGLILGRYARACEIGASFKVCDPNPAAEKILSLAGTGKMIEIYKTAKEK
ncbi:MAG: STAS domain-containing protein [Ruminococcaceae bacterium]|nr:STAS domain-containing protein [Oscillospiraceae bacterium]